MSEEGCVKRFHVRFRNLIREIELYWEFPVDTRVEISEKDMWVCFRRCGYEEIFASIRAGELTAYWWEYKIHDC